MPYSIRLLSCAKEHGHVGPRARAGGDVRVTTPQAETYSLADPPRPHHPFPGARVEEGSLLGA